MDLTPIKDEIIKRGWCQRVGLDTKGRVCLAAATGIVANGDLTRFVEMQNELRRRLRAIGSLGSGVVWNDAPERTMDDVLTLCSDKWETLK